MKNEVKNTSLILGGVTVGFALGTLLVNSAKNRIKKEVVSEATKTIKNELKKDIKDQLNIDVVIDSIVKDVRKNVASDILRNYREDISSLKKDFDRHKSEMDYKLGEYESSVKVMHDSINETENRIGRVVKKSVDTILDSLDSNK